jgi:hypothetical protein
MQVWQQWPWWLTEIVRTIVLVGIAYGIGQIVRLLVTARLGRLARRPDDWAEVILSEVRPRIGLWSVLVGLHFALRRWPLDAAQREDVQNVISALAIGSLTFAVAAVANPKV